MLFIYSYTCLGIVLVVYRLFKRNNAPIVLSKFWLGTVFFVVKYEKGKADLSPYENSNATSPLKKRIFFIPESLGVLERGHWYQLRFDLPKRSFYFAQL